MSAGSGRAARALRGFGVAGRLAAEHARRAAALGGRAAAGAGELGEVVEGRLPVHGHCWEENPSDTNRLYCLMSEGLNLNIFIKKPE